MTEPMKRKDVFNWVKQTVFLEGVTGAEIALEQNLINNSLHLTTTHSQPSEALKDEDGRYILKNGNRIFDCWIGYLQQQGTQLYVPACMLLKLEGGN